MRVIVYLCDREATYNHMLKQEQYSNFCKKKTTLKVQNHDLK